MGAPDVIEAATGVKFPRTQRFYPADTLEALGAGCRVKKVLLACIKVYAAALYIDHKAAASTLAAVKGGNVDEIAEALLTGQFRKVMQMHLVRNITGSQFAGALTEELKPRLKNEGHAEMKQLLDMFAGLKLHASTNFIIDYDGDEQVQFTMAHPGVTDFTTLQPLLTIESRTFAQALFHIWLGPQTLVPEGRKQFVHSAQQLVNGMNGTV